MSAPDRAHLFSLSGRLNMFRFFSSRIYLCYLVCLLFCYFSSIVRNAIILYSPYAVSECGMAYSKIHLPLIRSIIHQSNAHRYASNLDPLLQMATACVYVLCYPLCLLLFDCIYMTQICGFPPKKGWARIGIFVQKWKCSYAYKERNGMWPSYECEREREREWKSESKDNWLRTMCWKWYFQERKNTKWFCDVTVLRDFACKVLLDIGESEIEILYRRKRLRMEIIIRDACVTCSKNTCMHSNI